MKQCFIFRDGDIQKFWNIEVEGSGFTIVYGQRGTPEQSFSKDFSKTFDSAEQCEESAKRLIEEHKQKGYVEAGKELSPENQGKKYFFSYDDPAGTQEATPADLAQKILRDKSLPHLRHITIGAWGSMFGDSNPSVEGPDALLKVMVDHKEKFQHIESLFVGDMDYEECEISWILQGNYAELLQALPNLKVLKIKGANNLSLGEAPEHHALEELQIICGGLPRNVATELQHASFPSMKKLILYMGTENYGLTCSLEDMAAVARKEVFPSLKELGFVNSEQQDDVVEVLLASDILPQLDTLDVSCGCLTDRGGQMLVDGWGKLVNLKRLKADYHYMSTGMMKQLKNLPLDVSVADRQKADEINGEVYMDPMYTE